MMNELWNMDYGFPKVKVSSFDLWLIILNGAAYAVSWRSIAVIPHQ